MQIWLGSYITVDGDLPIRLIYPHYKHGFDVRAGGYASNDIAHVWKHGCSCTI